MFNLVHFWFQENKRFVSVPWFSKHQCLIVELEVGGAEIEMIYLSDHVGKRFSNSSLLKILSIDQKLVHEFARVHIPLVCHSESPN